MDASEAKMDPVVLAVTYKVPVVVEEEDTMLTWTVDTLSEVSTHLNTIIIFTISTSILAECVRVLHQLRDAGRLRGQRGDPPQHGDGGHPRQHGHHHQPPVSMQLQRNIHATY